MSANKRRSFLNMGRPFTPLFAAPSDGITAEARQLLIYVYPTATAPAAVVYPLSIVIALAAQPVSIGISMAQVVSIAITENQ